MSTEYKVKNGDCMASIAVEFGFFWETLWNLGDNSELKDLRKNPNVLMTGDKVIIPDLRTKDENRAVEGKYKFKRKGVPEKLRLKMLDSDKKPRANVGYKLFIDGNPVTGKTNGQGEITHPIPPDAQQVRLIMDDDAANQIKMNLGFLNPITTVSGFKARLANLGYYTGPLDETLDDRAKDSMHAFQSDNGMPTTDHIDDATRSKLQSMHGH